MSFVRSKALGFSVAAAFLVLLALCLQSFSHKSGQPLFSEERPLMFGAILPVSGAAAQSAHASEKGLLMAKEDIAAHPESYAPVRIFVGDSALDPVQGAAVAQGLLSDEIDADVLFSSFSYVTAAVTDIAHTAGAPLFYDSCNCGFAEENPLAFQIYFDPRKECRATAEYFKERGVTKAAFIGQDVPYGHYCFESVQDVFGIENVVIESEPREAMRDYSSLLTNLKEQSIGFVVSVPSVNDFVAFFEANHDSGAHLPIACFEGACLQDEIVNEVAPEALKDVIGFGFSIAPAFIERAVAKGLASRNEVLNAAVAHDAVLYAAAAARVCDDNACLVRELTSIHLDDPAILATGFGEDRILDYVSSYIKIKDGVPVSMPFDQ